MGNLCPSAPGLLQRDVLCAFLHNHRARGLCGARGLQPKHHVPKHHVQTFLEHPQGRGHHHLPVTPSLHPTTLPEKKVCGVTSWLHTPQYPAPHEVFLTPGLWDPRAVELQRTSWLPHAVFPWGPALSPARKPRKASGEAKPLGNGAGRMKPRRFPRRAGSTQLSPPPLSRNLV